MNRCSRLSARAFGCAAAAVLAVTLSAHAQSVGEAWTTDQGLPQNVVRAIHQARDGYLWIVTMDGVARFDGVRFTIFDRSNTPGIETNRFTAIYEDSNGDLWLASEGGVTRYHAGVFTTYSTRDGLPHPTVTGITGDAKGQVWVLSNGQVLRWDANRFVREPTALVPFTRSAWDSDIFFGLDRTTVYRFAHGQRDRWPLPESLRGRTNERIAQERSGALWIGVDNDGLAIVEDGRVRQTYTASRIAQHATPDTFDTPHLVYVGPDGRQWPMQVDHELHRLVTITEAGNPRQLRFSVAYGDREGSLWLGTINQGLYRLRERPVSVLSGAEGLAGENVYPILEDRRGAIWAGVWNAGVSRILDGKIRNFTPADGLPSQHPTALAEDRDGRLWVAGYARRNGGLATFGGDRFHPLTTQIVPDDTVITAIHFDAAGGMWLGTSHGLVRHRAGESKVFTVRDGLAGDDLKVIVDDGHGGLWIGASGGVTRFRDRVLERWTERDGLPSPNVRALYLDADGVLWIGTYDGGLARLKDGRITRYTTTDGLFNTGVFQILPDDGGFFWIGCNRGIYRLSRRELTAFADGSTSDFTSLVLGTSDGLLNAEANGGYWPAGTRARDGRLWIPTQTGIAIVDPKNFGSSSAPVPAVIERVLVDQKPIDHENAVRIGPQPQNVEIQYTALSFVNSRHMRFRYRLEGLDEDWIEAGTRRTAYFTHVPPGSYTFSVVAATAQGVWSATPASISVVVVPPFWRGWWFITLTVLVAAGLITLGYQRRVASMERARMQQEAFSRQLIALQEQERKRIAGELHDGLGQSLIVMRNWAALGASQLPANAPGREELDEVARTASRAIGEMREMAQNLAPYALERLGLAETLAEMIDSVQRSSGILFTRDLDPLDGLLSRDAEMSFYRVAQEAVNNILKHSGATGATIRLKRNGMAVRLTIEDNGRGFDASSLSSGMGLSSMAERIRLFDGQYAVRSAEGRGTTIEVTMGSGGTHAA
jgi:signal transduction histidine kinase/ligand-binding sensor domain-containing protein